MRAEAAKCDPLCRMCHALDPSSSSAECNRCRPGQGGACQDYATHATVHRRRVVHSARASMQKRDYNNARKRAVGRCERPGGCPSKDGPARDGECVAGIRAVLRLGPPRPGAPRPAASPRSATTRRCLATAKPEIDAERAKCRLLCSQLPQEAQEDVGQWRVISLVSHCATTPTGGIVCVTAKSATRYIEVKKGLT